MLRLQSDRRPAADTDEQMFDGLHRDAVDARSHETRETCIPFTHGTVNHCDFAPLNTVKAGLTAAKPQIFVCLLFLRISQREQIRENNGS